jgi:hypothetical protein
MLNIFNQENFDSKPDLATLRESIHAIDIFSDGFHFPFVIVEIKRNLI